LSLGDEQAVEGISMLVQKLVNAKSMAHLHWKDRDGIQCQLLGNKTFGIFGQLQPAQFGLDRYFPTACGAEEDLVGAVSDDPPGSGGQARVIGDPLKEDMGIEQNLHFSSFFESFQHRLRKGRIEIGGYGYLVAGTVPLSGRAGRWAFLP